MPDEDTWTFLKKAAEDAGYGVTDTGAQVQFKQNGQVCGTFSKSDEGHITGYMQACIYLASRGIKPRTD